MSVTFYPGTGAHDDRPELNVCNANARALLNVLGVELDDVELCGRMPAAEFGTHIQRAQTRIEASGEDDGTANVVEGNFVSFGRRPGYLADRLEALAAVAVWALDHDGDVIWS